MHRLHGLRFLLAARVGQSIWGDPQSLAVVKLQASVCCQLQEKCREQQSHCLQLTGAPLTLSCMTAVKVAGQRRRESSKFCTEQSHTEV